VPTSFTRKLRCDIDWPGRFRRARPLGFLLIGCAPCLVFLSSVLLLNSRASFGPSKSGIQSPDNASRQRSHPSCIMDDCDTPFLSNHVVFVPLLVLMEEDNRFILRHGGPQKVSGRTG